MVSIMGILSGAAPLMLDVRQTGGSPLLDEASVTEAIAAVEACGVQPVLVVLDTYARSMIGGDENSAKDAGLAIAAIDGLRFRLNTAVLVVHHMGKAGKTERGSGALRGAADTMLELEMGGASGMLILKVDAQKNFEAWPPMAIRLEHVGDSLVPEEVVDGRSKWAKAVAPPVDGKREQMANAIETALREAEADGRTPITQTALLKLVSGATKMKSDILHELAADPNSPVLMDDQGSKKLYRLHP
jgi:hypothetical protein